jgi:hypothetical protein
MTRLATSERSHREGEFATTKSSLQATPLRGLHRPGSLQAQAVALQLLNALVSQRGVGTVKLPATR